MTLIQLVATIPSATAPDPGNNGTITTSGVGIARVTPTANETGIILQAGTIDGQVVIVENKANFTLAMAIAGTSHVASGVSAVIPALGASIFEWDNGAALWYKVG